MFKNLAVLNTQQHRQLRFTPSQPYHFADSEMLIPIVASEAFVVAREYTIVFSLAGQTNVYALTGVDQGVNAYVAPSGHWLGRYVPAHVRRYPFILSEAPNGNGNGERHFVMQFDQDAPHMNLPDGAPLFTDEGEAAPMLQQVQEILLNLQKDFDYTQTLVAQLDAAGVLVEDGLRVQPKQADDKQTVLQGFRLVDVKALGQLEADKLAQLRDSGALALAYAHLLSLTNLRDGVLTAPKGSHAAAALEARRTAHLNDGEGSISFEGVDWTKVGH